MRGNIYRERLKRVAAVQYPPFGGGGKFLASCHAEFPELTGRYWKMLANHSDGEYVEMDLPPQNPTGSAKILTFEPGDWLVKEFPAIGEYNFTKMSDEEFAKNWERTE